MSFSTSTTRPKSAGSLRRPNTPSNGMSNYSYRNFNSFNSPQNPLQISSQNSTSASFSNKKNGNVTTSSYSQNGTNSSSQQALPAQVDHWSTSYKLHYGYAAAEAIQMGINPNINNINNSNNNNNNGTTTSNRPMTANSKAISGKAQQQQQSLQPPLMNISSIPDIINNNNNNNKYLNHMNPPIVYSTTNNNNNNSTTSSKNSNLKEATNATINSTLPAVGSNSNNNNTSNHNINNNNVISGNTNGRFPAVPLSAIISQQQQQYQQQPVSSRSSADRIRTTVAANRLASNNTTSSSSSASATTVTTNDENGENNNVLYSHNGVKLSGNNNHSNNSNNHHLNNALPTKPTQVMTTTITDMSHDLSHMTLGGVGVSVGVGQTTYHNTIDLDHAAATAATGFQFHNTHKQQQHTTTVVTEEEDEEDIELTNIDTAHTNTREQQKLQQQQNKQGLPKSMATAAAVVKHGNSNEEDDDDDDDEMDGKRLNYHTSNNINNNINNSSSSSSSTHYGTSAPVIMMNANGGVLNISNTGIVHHTGGSASESRSHPEVNTPSLASLELGGSNITISSSSSILLGDGRNNSMDSLNDEFIDLGITTVPNQFCTVRDALELKRMLLLTHGVRGGMVPSATSVMDMYMVGKVIGVGSYGKVRAAWHRLTGAKVAIKTYDKSKMKDESHWKRVHSEIKIMEQVSHPRIARMYEAIETPKRMHLIMECLEGGNLCSYVKQKRRLNEEEARGIFFQLIQSIEYLHSLNVTHRDIKLENILFTSNKENCRDIKLIDFGFSTVCQVGKKLKVFCGTPSYMAPEIVRRTEYEGKATDMWSLGILLYALLCGCFPFRAKSYPDLYRRIARGTFIIPDDINSSVRDLITQLLELDVNKRLTANIAIRHPWLQTALYLSPDMKKMRGDIPYLISDRPSDDLDDTVLKEMEKFGMPREEIIRLILTKLHSSLTTFYYLLLDIAIRRRKKMNNNTSFNNNNNNNNNSNNTMTEIKLSSYNNNNMINISSHGNNHNSSTASAKSTGAIPNRTSSQTVHLLQQQQQQTGINSFRDKTSSSSAPASGTTAAGGGGGGNTTMITDYPTVNYLAQQQQQQRPRSSSSSFTTHTSSSGNNNNNKSNNNNSNNSNNNANYYNINNNNMNLASSATTNNLGGSNNNSNNSNNNGNNNGKNNNNTINVNTIRLGSGNNNYNNNNNGNGIQINQLQRPLSAYAGRRG